MPIAFVQSTAQGQISSKGVSVTAAFASANTAGNLLLAGSMAASTADPSTVTDSAGNTWVRAYTSTDGPGARRLVIWHVLNALGSTNRVSLSVTSGGAATRKALHIAEYSGLSQTLGTDTAASTSGSDSRALTPAFATTVASELLFAFAVDGAVTYSTVNGFDNLIQNSSGRSASAGRTVSATASTYVGAFSMSAAGGWGILCAAYQADPPAGGLLKNPYSLLRTGVEG